MNHPVLAWIQQLEVPAQLAWLLMVVFGVIILMSFLLVIARRYKRCPSNRILVIYGKTGAGRSAKCLHGGGAFRAVDREHPRQRAERLHRRDRNRRGDDDERRDPPPGSRDEGHRQAGRGHDLRPAAPGDRLDAHRGDQQGPRRLPGEGPDLARARAAQDRPRADQREHQGHHRRVRLHRGDRQEGGVRGDPAGGDRRLAAGEEGRDGRRRGGPRQGDRRRQRREAARHGHEGGRARPPRAARRPGERAQDRRAGRGLPPGGRHPGSGAHHAHLGRRREREGRRRREQGQGGHRERQRRAQGQGSRGLPGRRNAHARRAGGRARGAVPRAGQGRRGPGQVDRGAEARRARGAGEGDEGPGDRRRRSRGREAQDRGPGRGRGDLRQARRRGARQLRDPGEEGPGPEADRRELRRRPGGVPDAHAGAHRGALEDRRRGDRERQVREDRRVGPRR